MHSDLLHHGMQDWQNLVQKYEEVFPKAELVEIMSSQGRTMAHLIAGEQQRQINATKLQHTSRLQSQKQLTEALLQMLASTGECLSYLSASLPNRAKNAMCALGP